MMYPRTESGTHASVVGADTASVFHVEKHSSAGYSDFHRQIYSAQGKGRRQVRLRAPGALAPPAIEHGSNQCF